MEQISLKSLFAEGIFNAISRLRSNENSYPYVTLVGPFGSNNVYFGKRSAEVIGAKYAIGDDITKELIDATVILSQNAQGENRYKLSLQGTLEDYTSAGELSNMFGVEQKIVNTEFNLDNFKKEFTTVSANTAANNGTNTSNIGGNPAAASSTPKLGGGGQQPAKQEQPVKVN